MLHSHAPNELTKKDKSKNKGLELYELQLLVQEGNITSIRKNFVDYPFDQVNINELLCTASSFGRVEIAKMLIKEFKADINYRIVLGNTPLHCTLGCLNASPIINSL